MTRHRFSEQAPTAPLHDQVFLAGEGPNELGDWFREGPYRPSTEKERRTAKLGVMEALLRRVRTDGWHVGGAIAWKSIRKLRVNRPGHGDRHNVVAAALHASEAGCEIFAMVRDRDGERAREEAIDDGLRAAREAHADELVIIGGTAVEELEGWILALLGVHGSEDMRHPESPLAARGIPAKETGAFVRAVDAADLSRLPSDATSLRAWLLSAHSGFSLVRGRAD